MEFLRFVEEELRGLAAEARRRHPVVQEAADRAILRLRNMREEYAVALRQQHEGKAPPLSMFRSQDLLRPFLLACNHGDASPHLIIMAMGSIQYLINRDAILPSDAPNIFRVLAIQSQSKEADVQKRVLQTMVMVITWKSCDMTEDTVAQALGVCLGLHDAKNAMVRTAADMTVRQIISLLFDRVADELGVVPAEDAASTDVRGKDWAGAAEGVPKEGSSEKGEREAGSEEGALRCAHLVFQDLCVLSRGEQGQWIKRTSVSAALGLELIEQVLSQQPALFRRFDLLKQLLSREVCPLILHTLRRRMHFPLLVRLLRAASTLAINFGDLLPKEVEAIFSAMLASLGTGLGDDTSEQVREGDGSIDFTAADDDGTGGCVSWPAMLTLEAVHRLLGNPPLLLELFCNSGTVEEVIGAVSQHLVRNLNSQHSIQALESMAQSLRLGRSGSGEGRKLPLPTSLANALARDAPNSAGSEPNTHPPPGSGVGARGAGVGNGLRSRSNTVRSSSSELLHETEEPGLDDAEPLLWALQCVVDFAAAVASLVDDEFGTSDVTLVVPSSVALAPGAVLPEGSRREALRNVCEKLWSPVLSSLSHVMVHCSDPLVVSTAADGYSALAVASGILGVENAVDGFVGSLCRFSLPQWHGADVVVGGGAGGSGGGQTGGSSALGWNHVGGLESVMLIAHRLGNLLRGSWHVIVHTLEQAARFLVRRSIARPRWSPQAADTELAEVERHCAEVLQAAERLVQFSTCLEDEALYTLMSSLQALAVVNLANTATVLPQERASSRDMAQQQQQQQQQQSQVKVSGLPAGGVGAGAGAGSAAVAAASGIVSFVGAAARGVGAAMSEGREALSRDANSNAKASKGAGDRGARNPWVSSRLVVDCAAANTWRLPVVWELASGHLRVVAKARDRATREYAVRALRELIVDGVQRLHHDPTGPSQEGDGSTSSVSPSQKPQIATAAGNATVVRPVAPSAAPKSRGVMSRSSSTASGGGGGGGASEEGFIPSLMALRGRLEGGGEDHPFRWIFGADVSQVFVSESRQGRCGLEGMANVTPGGDSFEGVLFKTMGLFAMTPHVDTREATLQTLYSVLQSCGQVLDSAWAVILDLLHAVAQGATDAPPPALRRRASDGESGEGVALEAEGEEGEEEFVDDARNSGTAVAWGGACLSLAFKCLQIIVDDFLERLPREQVPKLVTCTGAFGAQTENVNLSLTGIGMLWTVCDTFADASTASPGGSPGQDTSSPSPLPDEGRPSLQYMWPTMLFQLRSLAVDFRPELRNCAVNTLFSAAVGNGSGLSSEEWKQFLLEVTFPLIEEVVESTQTASSGANTAVAPELKKGVRMLMHHTRDTDQKQWNETRVLAMQGLGRVLRAYVGDLARHKWFVEEGGVWSKSLQVYREACSEGSDSQEVSLAGVDGLTTLVLLVGRMGLKSVHVRAGTGMKIVDGTLQRSPSTSENSVGPGGVPPARVKAAMTPEFAHVRPKLYRAAWEAMVAASSFEVDESGDVAPAFVQGLAAVYRAGVEQGAEFSPGQEGEEERMQQLFDILDSLFPPRIAPANRVAASPDAPPRRAIYLPKVTPGQRAVLDFLQEDLRSGWPLALRLLAKYSVTGAGEESGGAPGSAAAGGVVLVGAGAGTVVSVECQKEAAAALSGLMSERVPQRDRALALEGLLTEVSAPCGRRVKELRRAVSKLEASADETLASRWPSLDSYSEVMRLLLTLLADGLKCLSAGGEGEGEGASEKRRVWQSSEIVVRALMAAVTAVGAVAECHRLASLMLRRSAAVPLGAGDGGVMASDQEENGAGFAMVLQEALSSIAVAVCRNLVPLAKEGSADAEEVVRALIDTLGVIGCAGVVATPLAHSLPTHSYRSDDVAVAPNTFSVILDQLCSIAGGNKIDGGHWASLGLPLRRRACWHLLRCVWSTARCFQAMEDVAPPQNSGENVSNGDAQHPSDAALAAVADRCARSLEAVGKLRLPPALLSPRFNKLAATKQAQEERLLVEETPPASPVAKARANGGEQACHHRPGSGADPATEDVAWASMAEEDGDKESSSPDSVEAQGEAEEKSDEDDGRGHLMLLCRTLLACSTSRTEAVRSQAASLLAQADIPGALDSLQDEVIALKRELRQREAQLSRKDREVADLRAQVAAGSFML